MAKIPRSKKLEQEEAAKLGRSGDPGIEIVKKNDGAIKIAPIKTFNEWVILLPFSIDSNLILPKDSTVKHVGMVVGKSDTIMAPNGQYITSRLDIGMMVLFPHAAVVQKIEVHKDPYIGRTLFMIHERNVYCQVAPVPFEIVESVMDEEAFK